MITRRLALVVAPLLVVAGCGLFSSRPGPDEVAGDFLTRLASGDTAGAAALTDDPGAAKDLLDKVRGALKPAGVRGSVEQVRSAGESSTAEATAALEWDFGHDHVWKYQTKFELRREEDDWRVHWVPSVVHPKLAAQQTLAATPVKASLAPVLDRDGAALLAPEQVVSVLLDPTQAGDVTAVATTLATALNPIDPAITRESIVDGAGKTAAGQVYQVAALRDADYQTVKPVIYELPGVRFTTQTSLLAPSRGFASQVLPAVRKFVEEDVEGRAGVRVFTANGSGDEVDSLYEQQPVTAQAVTTGLSRAVQTAAEDAVESSVGATMLVAIQPSTGEILAVAQNAAADEQGAIALTGRFAPGSTFKIVSAAHALAGGTAADVPVPCPGKTTIDGRRVVPNDHEFDKGTIPLHSAFAYSCNTTFAQLAVDYPADGLTKTADSFGLGVDFEIPALTTITGSVPAATDVVERAEDAFGQGKVLASPFGMALVAATVAKGSVPVPSLLRGRDVKADHTPTAPPPAVLEPLRVMMREVVEVGTAQLLNGLGDVRGKTGTAQYGDGTRSHGWFVGYRGDVAFATLVLDGNSSVPALEATGRFLRALG
ncbi:penicillin-binding transpeptidase domain-containing protein [Saccharothrix violaceirubra]|uniref:Cell division protein FtsI/penicillin-binding protein 2 n=1 Tax=Saccharothrix violaceirubra TaxID=413306 RepID=A0A7W7T268_9PSEU|nr:penicillin-binding transpeptidase domain-containing protein [Saccharothrix violaceirubra]MBB4963975.1 cell division protein FtsI/penicillin-binding protein 2 [Saccharothrix violaceirubra]